MAEQERSAVIIPAPRWHRISRRLPRPARCVNGRTSSIGERSGGLTRRERGEHIPVTLTHRRGAAGHGNPAFCLASPVMPRWIQVVEKGTVKEVCRLRLFGSNVFDSNAPISHKSAISQPLLRSCHTLDNAVGRKSPREHFASMSSVWSAKRYILCRSLKELFVLDCSIVSDADYSMVWLSP
uniref:Uncharacterized protein n=1 Tax=Corethron hystrix TaxID=216773 RepID=A0A6U5ENS4_9STRA|mmetsp:Transcript_18651/g.42617  ORF Transcript_18651/g.42617 Transcript_18651/m.42617 type:complete len:182 (+) Transcript_18651:238-783(+)